jgi:hypothetical protein
MQAILRLFIRPDEQQRLLQSSSAEGMVRTKNEVEPWESEVDEPEENTCLLRSLGQ